MAYGELNLGPVPTFRDATNGRFMKGHIPANKGKKWSEYLSRRAQRGSAKGWKNLELHRHRPPNAGRAPKPVVAIMDDGRFKILPSLREAGEWCGGHWENVGRCCRENALRHVNTDHRYKGIRFYFMSDDSWICKRK